MADNNRGKSPGTAQASRERAKSPDWSLAPVNEARQMHTHLTGCQHITDGVYVVTHYVSGRRWGLAKVVTSLPDDRLAVRRAGSDAIMPIARRQLRIADPDEWTGHNPVHATDGCTQHIEQKESHDRDPRGSGSA